MGDTYDVRLPDGRTMAYADHGDPAGPVVLTCVGTPDSRLVDRRLVSVVDRLGVRILVPDRPGFGRSDLHPGRTLLDWPADAAALLDALGVDRCGVSGGSGGGPYAVAYGVLLADWVTAVALGRTGRAARCAGPGVRAPAGGVAAPARRGDRPAGPGRPRGVVRLPRAGRVGSVAFSVTGAGIGS